MSQCNKDGFELLDSSMHTLQFHPIIIKHMDLFVEPNYENQSITCIQKLKLECTINLDKPILKLDCSNLNIKEITNTKLNGRDLKNELGFLINEDKLSIKLPGSLKKDDNLEIKIEYGASPKRGFRFIKPDSLNPKKQIQTWTQGQMIESRFWFPCIDEPQLKFPWDISVAVPTDYTVISNGHFIGTENRNDMQKIFKWKESIPNSNYLVSIVSGKFYEKRENYESILNEDHNKKTVELSYYVPEDKKESIERSFHWTPDVIRFFEEYFGTSYPYSKYSQTTVQDFEYGGMENVTCTTLPDDTLLDKRASIDNTSTRNVIAHELAHQWFGDLITCKDWAHIWLNEGMATYCEALYIEELEKKDEFQHYMRTIANYYIRKSCTDYKRPIVTNIYKYPDELFDSHSYQKGAWVLHMIRNSIGDELFRKLLKKCLVDYKEKNIDTDEFCKALEEISEKDFKLFFKQWVYSPGHPELDISYDEKSTILNINQNQETPFNFIIDLKVYNSSGGIPGIYPLSIKNKENQFTLSQITNNQETTTKIDFISIDPELKVLKDLKKYSLAAQMILNQIQNGETTIERIQAINGLSIDEIDDSKQMDRVIEILREKVLNDKSFRVAAVAAAKLGTIKTDKSFNTLKICLEKMDEKSGREKSIKKSALIDAIGQFIPEKKEIREKLEMIIDRKDETDSYSVLVRSISAMGKYKDREAFEKIKKQIQIENTFGDVIPVSAISSLGNFKDVSDIENDGINLLVEKTFDGNSNPIRLSAVETLGPFLIKKEKEIRENIFNILINSLHDKWPDTRKAALTILENTFSPDDINLDQDKIDQILKTIDQMTINDPNYDVRRIAEISLVKIREKEAKRVEELFKTKENISLHISNIIKSRTQNNLMPKLDMW